MEWKVATRKDSGEVAIPNRWLKIHYYDALNTLFRVENALRVFVYVVLKTAHLDKWQELCVATEDDQQTNLVAMARKRIEQTKLFGYLGIPITCPVMHLSTVTVHGERVRKCWVGGKE